MSLGKQKIVYLDFNISPKSNKDEMCCHFYTGIRHMLSSRASIHPFIHSFCSPLLLLESIPAVGLQRQPVHRRATKTDKDRRAFTLTRLSTIGLTRRLWNCGRKQENPAGTRTHKGSMERNSTQKGPRPGIKLTTFLLWGESANQCITVLSLIRASMIIDCVSGCARPAEKCDITFVLIVYGTPLVQFLMQCNISSLALSRSLEIPLQT